MERIIDAWLPLTFAVNSINRSMGMQDLYPFVLAPSVIVKLAFIHDRIRGEPLGAARRMARCEPSSRDSSARLDARRSVRRRMRQAPAISIGCAPSHSTIFPSLGRLSSAEVMVMKYGCRRAARPCWRNAPRHKPAGFPFAQSAGIEDDLSWRGVAGLVLGRDAEVGVAERDPDRLAAPPHMDDALPVRQQALEKGAGPGGKPGFKARLERERARGDDKVAHRALRLIIVPW